jgi:hypothetical protein
MNVSNSINPIKSVNPIKCMDIMNCIRRFKRCMFKGEGRKKQRKDVGGTERGMRLIDSVTEREAGDPLSESNVSKGKGCGFLG